MATKKAAGRAATKSRGKKKVLVKKKAAGSGNKAPAKTSVSPRSKPKARSAPPAGGRGSPREAKAKAAKPTKAKEAAPKNQKPTACSQTEQREKSSSKRVAKAKVLPKSFLLELAEAIRQAVREAILASKGREIVGTAPSGDPTFEIDRIAEKTLLSFLKNAKMPVAYYSEEAGYTTFTSAQPTNLLVVDPIDGTRAAKCGFEGCVVALASTRVIERPTFADVDNGCVMEIMNDRVFYAERGKGARVHVEGRARKIRLSQNTDLETVAWAMTVPARPAELIFPTAARLIDLTSLKGGFFACNSTSFSLTRLLTGQLDACIDFANRYYRDIPSVVEDQFINAGRGVVLGICPYDLVAAFLIAQEAGCTVTDAYGQPLDDVLLLDSSVTNQRSLIGAANPELHATLLKFFDTRIKQYETLLKRRMEAATAT